MSDYATTAGGLADPVNEPLHDTRHFINRTLTAVDSRTSVVRGLGWHHRLGALVTVTDTAMITLALLLTFILRFGGEADSSVAGTSFLSHEFVAVGFGAVWMLALAAKESRRARILGAGLEEYRRVVSASLHAFGALAILSYLAQADVSRWFFVATLPVGTALLLLGRWVIRDQLTQARLAGRAAVTTLVIGDEHDVRATLADLRRNPGAGYQPVAVAITDLPRKGEAPRELEGVSLVPYADVETYIAHQALGAVVVAGGVSPRAGRRLAWRMENTHTQLLFVPRLTDVAGPRLSLRHAAGLDLIHVELPRYSGTKYWLKRSFDLVFAAAALVALAPVLAVIALAIKLEDGGPVIFSQARVGLKGKAFTIHKFRTMHTDAEARLAELLSKSISDGPLFKMADDPRVTRVGRILRKYSLDELPQFWTVLRGHMSVVGPRPHLAHELAAFPDEGLRRLLIKPGITGLWQVSGRSDLSLEDSIKLDLRYVENWSIVGDLVIVLQTVKAMVTPKGAY